MMMMMSGWGLVAEVTTRPTCKRRVPSSIPGRGEAFHYRGKRKSFALHTWWRQEGHPALSSQLRIPRLTPLRGIKDANGSFLIKVRPLAEAITRPTCKRKVAGSNLGKD